MATGSIVFEDRVRIPSNVFTLDEFRRWAHSDDFPPRGRFSFLNGEVDVDMSPEEIETHNKVKGAVNRDLGAWVLQYDLGELLSDRALVVNESANLSTEPDLTFCSWERLESGHASFREAVEGSERFVEVVGAPDLAVEVVSQTSVRKDTVVLPELYFNAGVQEYWLIDARRGQLRFQILRSGVAQFEPVEPDDNGFLRSDVLGGTFRLDREQNRLGTARYVLQSSD